MIRIGFWGLGLKGSRVLGFIGYSIYIYIYIYIYIIYIYIYMESYLAILVIIQALTQ